MIFQKGNKFHPKNKSKDVWKKIDKKADTECWEWLGYKDRDGYGRFSINNEMYLTHRLIYELKCSKIPEGLCVLHRCDNPSCCNPHHLFLGTNKDNFIDMTAKNRRAKGENQGTHKLTNEQVIEIRKMYSTGKYTQEKLGNKFNVVHSTISYIVNNRLWKHILKNK